MTRFPLQTPPAQPADDRALETGPCSFLAAPKRAEPRACEVGFLLACAPSCPDGETGRRIGLKIRREQSLAGSIPAPGTKSNSDEYSSKRTANFLPMRNDPTRRRLCAALLGAGAGLALFGARGGGQPSARGHSLSDLLKAEHQPGMAAVLVDRGRVTALATAGRRNDATGVRVRDYPVTLDKLLKEMPAPALTA